MNVSGTKNVYLFVREMDDLDECVNFYQKDGTFYCSYSRVWFSALMPCGIKGISLNHLHSVQFCIRHTLSLMFSLIFSKCSLCSVSASLDECRFIVERYSGNFDTVVAMISEKLKYEWMVSDDSDCDRSEPHKQFVFDPHGAGDLRQKMLVYNGVCHYLPLHLFFCIQMFP